MLTAFSFNLKNYFLLLSSNAQFLHPLREVSSHPERSGRVMIQPHM